MRKIRFHISFWPVAAYFFISGGAERFVGATMLVFLHEMGHIFAALVFGLKFDEILIMPIGERAIIKGIYSVGRVKRAAIFLSGPVVSIIISAILWLIGNKEMAQISLYLGVFNLLPIFPLDGGNVLMTALGVNGDMWAAKRVLWLSKLISKLIIALGIIKVILYPYNLDIVVAGLFADMIGAVGSAGVYRRIIDSLASPAPKNVRGVKLLYVTDGFREMDVLDRMNGDRFNIIVKCENSRLTYIHQRDFLGAVFKNE